MQPVSSSYNAYPDRRYAGMRALFRVVDLTAATDATVTASEEAAISQKNQTLNDLGMSYKLGTLETDGFPLDGTYYAVPDSLAGVETGWWSNLSGSDGTFASPPTLTYTFGSTHSSYGFSVIFDDKADWFPASYTIAAYDASNVLIDSETVTCTSAFTAVVMPVSNYKKVVLTFNATRKGYQRVRSADVAFGVVESFDRANIKVGVVLHELTPNASSLPTAEIVLTFDNADHKYNMLAANSIYAYLQDGQPIDVWIGVGETSAVEYVYMGRFYFAKSESDDDALTAKITAYDRFYQLGKTKCNIGTTGTWTVSAAVAAVVADCGLTMTPVIPSSVGARVIGKAIPQGTYYREAFRLIAQAGQSTCIFNRDDNPEFIEITIGTSVDTLDGDNMASNAKITVTDRINTVVLTVNDEYAGTETTYTAADVGAGETAQTLNVTNPLGTQATADWLLAMAQHRIVYTLDERGNPAVEIGDTVTVYDAYGVNGDAVITKQQLSYDGGLTVDAKGWA